MRKTRFIFLLFAACACSTASRGNNAEPTAAHLGYEGCKLSKPLTKAQMMEKDMSGQYESGRPHPDWDELIRQYTAGDSIYFIDCKKADASRISAGTSLYALVRDGVIIARAQNAASN